MEKSRKGKSQDLADKIRLHCKNNVTTNISPLLLSDASSTNTQAQVRMIERPKNIS